MFYIVGAGGFGRETLDLAVAAGVDPVTIRFVAERREGEQWADEVRGVPVLDIDDVKPGNPFVVAIGDGAARERISNRMEDERGCRVARPLIHPSATIASTATIDPGCIITAGVRVSTGVVLADQVHLNYNATVGHEAQLGGYVTVMPGVNISGGVRLGDRVTMGTGSAILQGLSVAEGVFVGAGAVVTKDCAEVGTVLVGIPARPIGQTGTTRA